MCILCICRSCNAITAAADAAEWHRNHGNVHSDDALFTSSAPWRTGHALHTSRYYWGGW